MTVKLDASATYPDDYLPPHKYALVIGCVDVRLLDDLVRFLGHDNLINRYYHLTFAGASLAFSSHSMKDVKHEGGIPLHFDAWTQMLEDHIKVILKLTAKQLFDVYIVEHRDCGAYRECLEVDFGDTKKEQQDELELHESYAVALKHKLKLLFEGLVEKGHATKVPRVMSFLMDLRGDVMRLDVPKKATERPRSRKA